MRTFAVLLVVLYSVAFAAAPSVDVLALMAEEVLAVRPEQALALLEEASPETLKVTDEAFLQLKKDLACLGVAPVLVLQDFSKDVGEIVTVALVTGDTPLRIEGVAAEGVKAIRRVMKDGVASTETFTFTVKDLAPREKYRRLSERSQQGFQIARALWVLQAGKRDPGLRELERIPGVLAAALVSNIHSEFGDPQEEQAEIQWFALLGQLGLVDVAEQAVTLELELRSGLGDRAAAFVSAAPAASRLLLEYGGTRFVQERTGLLELFQTPAEDPGVIIPIPASSMNVASAIAKLAVENELNEEMTFSYSSRRGFPSLNLSGNPTLSGLGSLRGLQLLELNLRGTAVESLTPLKEMPLQSLELSGTRVRSLTPLRDGQLRTLRTSAVLEDLAGLEGNPLEKLWVASDQVRSVIALRHHEHLKVLDISATRIADLSPLTDLPLETLILGVEVKDLSALANCPLKTLDIRTCGVRDLGPLEDMELVKLFVGSEIHDLRPLKDQPLRSLALENSQVADLSPLEGMPIETLRIVGGEKLRNLAVLEDMPLVHLTLDTPDVRDLSVLSSCAELKVLDTSRMVIADLAVFSGCTNLTHLAIHPDSKNTLALHALSELEYIENDFKGGWKQKAKRFWKQEGNR